jgi:hypothetical protein
MSKFCNVNNVKKWHVNNFLDVPKKNDRSLNQEQIDYYYYFCSPEYIFWIFCGWPDRQFTYLLPNVHFHQFIMYNVKILISIDLQQLQLFKMKKTSFNKHTIKVSLSLPIETKYTSTYYKIWKYIVTSNYIRVSITHVKEEKMEDAVSTTYDQVPQSVQPKSSPIVMTERLCSMLRTNCEW